MQTHPSPTSGFQFNRLPTSFVSPSQTPYVPSDGMEDATFGSLALLGEADAARKWIEDATCNRQHKPMSVAFFRRWLKREQEMTVQHPHPHGPAVSQTVPMRVTGTMETTGVMRSSSSQSSTPGNQRQGERYRLPSLMHLAAEDQRARGGKR